MWRYLSKEFNRNRENYLYSQSRFCGLFDFENRRLEFFGKKSLNFVFLFFYLVVPSKRTFTKKSGGVTSSIDKRYNPLNQEEQDSSSSSDDLETMTEVCHQIYPV
jgi:hypothetical protein